MPEINNNFIKGRMNKDLDERLVPKGEYRDAMNVQVTSSDDTDVGVIQNIKGNSQVFKDFQNSLINEFSSCVGSVSHEKENTVYWFVADRVYQDFRIESQMRGSLQQETLFTPKTNEPYKDLILSFDGNEIKPVFTDIWRVVIDTSALAVFDSPGTSPASTHPLFRYISQSLITHTVAYVSRDIASSLKPNMSVTGIHIDTTGGNLTIERYEETNLYVEKVYIDVPSSTGSIVGHAVVFNRVIQPITPSGIQSPTYYNYLVFSSERCLNFNKDNIITGINIVDATVKKGTEISSDITNDLMFWTDNVSEPKKINIQRSIQGSNIEGTVPTKLIVNDEDLGFVEEKHVRVIKERPYNTLSLDLQALPEAARGEAKTDFLVDFDGTDRLIQIGDTFTVTINPSNTKKFKLNNIVYVRETNALSSSSDIINDYYIKFRITSSNEYIDSSGNIFNQNEFEFLVIDIDSSIFINSVNTTTNVITYKSEKDYTFLAETYKDDVIFKNKFPRFSYRYKYEDGEYSAFAPFTEVAFIPGKEFQYDTSEAFNIAMENNLTSVILRGFRDNYTPKDVVSIDLLYKESNSTSVYVIDTVSKKDNITSNEETFWQKNEYTVNSEILDYLLPEDQLLRQFDNVPRYAKSQEISASRLIYGNYVQNYNLDYDINIQSGITSRNIKNLKSIKSNRDYQIGVSFLDRAGRESPVFSNSNSSFKVPFEEASNSNEITAKIINTAPPWADRFKFYIKDVSTEYYNLALDRVYDAEDDNIWLSFPSSDRNKIDDETFLHLKKEHTTNNFITEYNRYKVIAISNEAPDYIKTKTIELGRTVASGQAVATPLATVFSTTTTAFLPVENVKEFRIKRSRFINQIGGIGNPNLKEVEGKLSMRIRIDPTGLGQNFLFSKYYKIGNIEENDNASFDFFHFKLEDFIDESFHIIDVNGTSPDTIFNSSLTIIFYKNEVENKPEFDGRFFVKIKKDDLSQRVLMSHIATANINQITGTIPAFYLADFRPVDNVGYGNANTLGGGTTTNDKSNVPNDWSLNAQFNGGSGTENSAFFIDQTMFLAKITDASVGLLDSSGSTTYMRDDGNGFVPWTNGRPDLTPRTSGSTTNFVDAQPYSKGVGSDANGRFFIDLAYFKFKRDLEPPSRAQMHKRELQEKSASKRYGELWTVPASDAFDIVADNPDMRSLIENLYVGNRFKINTNEVIFTITDIEINYYLNHTSGEFNPVTSGVSSTTVSHNPEQIYADMSFNLAASQAGNYFTMRNWEQYLKRLGKGSNRRVVYRIYVASVGNVDPASNFIDNNRIIDLADIDDFISINFLTTDYQDENQLTTNNPAIFETEIKETNDLDLYYSISDALPVYIGDSEQNLATSLAPIGSILTSDKGLFPTPQTRIFGWDNDVILLSHAAVDNGNNFNQYDKIKITRLDGVQIEVKVLNLVDPRLVAQGQGAQFTFGLKIDSYIANSKITIPYFNCYSFGNGVESNRIRDDFNQVTIDKGPQVSSILKTSYLQERKEHSLIFSSIYNYTTGVNGLNEFLIAENITKDLNPTYGSIQKLFTRQTDLVAFCEDRVVKILSNKDALFNADGNPQITATNKVLGQTVPFVGEYGISKNPESFAVESYRAYFSDKQRGAVLRLSMDGLTPISEAGMSYYFKNYLKNYDLILGSYDTDKDEYNLTLTNRIEDIVEPALISRFIPLDPKNPNPGLPYTPSDAPDPIINNDDEVYGCTNPRASNYNPNATVDDGSCRLEEQLPDQPVFGTSSTTGTGTTGTTTTGTGTGTSSTGVGVVINPTTQISTGVSGTGPFSGTVVFGCTNPAAVNYNPSATVDDGSCIISYGIGDN